MKAAVVIPPPPELEVLIAGLPGEAATVMRGLLGALEHSRSKVSELELLVRLREEQLRMARIDKYGPRSEKLSAAQILLLDLEPAVQTGEVEAEAARPDSEKQAAAPPAPRRKPRTAYTKAHPGRAPLPAHLPRIELILPWV